MLDETVLAKEHYQDTLNQLGALLRSANLAPALDQQVPLGGMFGSRACLQESVSVKIECDLCCHKLVECLINESACVHYKILSVALLRESEFHVA